MIQIYISTLACRPRRDSPLALSGVRLLLPQPEFDYLEAAASTASSFVVELQGEWLQCKIAFYFLGTMVDLLSKQHGVQPTLVY
jgi:hypothetical protein